MWRAWADKYKDKVSSSSACMRRNSPSRRNIDNVKRAVRELGVTYPIAIDNDYAIWQGFNNEFWPAHYFIDAEGRIRHHHFGEGEYAEIRKSHPVVACRSQSSGRLRQTS
ncbi:MAG: hypothetical protein WDN29_06435 [Methylovirgula sp.]